MGLLYKLETGTEVQAASLTAAVGRGSGLRCGTGARRVSYSARVASVLDTLFVRKAPLLESQGGVLGPSSIREFRESLTAAVALKRRWSLFTGGPRGCRWLEDQSPLVRLRPADSSSSLLCASGLRRLLHQPAVGLRRVFGGGPGGSEEGG